MIILEIATIALGLIATKNEEITFSLGKLNLPEGTKVYLEDRQLSVLTELSITNANYKVTLTEDNNDGRFFLITSSSALSVDNNTIEGLSIFKTKNNMLRIVGLQQGNASLNIYNILGKQVMQTSFEASGVNKDVELSNLSTGVYIVKLQTIAGNLSQKIIID